VYVCVWLHAREQDTAGSERFAALSAHYCRAAGAALLAYDITDAESFTLLHRSLKMLRDGGAQPDCFVVVVGTKLDLVTEQHKPRAVTTEQGAAYAASIGAAFLETRYDHTQPRMRGHA
jgi:GTPase SAR1 family protein